MIEFLRADEPGMGYPSLTIAQWVSLALFATGLAFFLSLKYWSPGRQPIDMGLRKVRVPAGVDVGTAANRLKAGGVRLRG